MSNLTKTIKLRIDATPEQIELFHRQSGRRQPPDDVGGYRKISYDIVNTYAVLTYKPPLIEAAVVDNSLLPLAKVT